MSAKKLRAKEVELQKELFPWLQSLGLAKIEQQVEVKIKIVTIVKTFDLVEADWKTIFGDTIYWDQDELSCLTECKKGNNSYESPPRGFTREKFLVGVNRYFKEKKLAYRISVIRSIGSSTLKVAKVLANTRKKYPKRCKPSKRQRIAIERNRERAQ